MPGSTNGHRVKSTRRAFIAAGGVGSVTLLAGCFGEESGNGGNGGNGDNGSGNGGNGDNSSGNGGGGEVHDERFRVFDPAGTNPSDRHFNPWNPSNAGAWHPGAAVFDKLAIFSPASNEAYPLIATGWEMTDDTTLEAELSDEWTWHNGDQFVAQDWTMQAEIEIALAEAAAEGDEQAHVMESVEAVDDQMIRVNLHNPLSETFAVQNSIGIFHDLIGRGVFTKHDDDQWSEWHEALVNGDDSEAAIEEITSTPYPMLTDEPIGNGPFQVADIGDSEIILEKYEDHPNADSINHTEFSLQVYSDQQQIFQAFNGGQVDAGHSQFPMQDDQMNQLPDSLELFREGRSANNLFTFNCGYEVEGYDTPFDNQNVRKAVAHLYNREQAQQLLQGEKILFEYPPCRVPHAVLEQEGGEISGINIEEEFTLYGQNDTERATELLEGEGYSLEDGEWYDPDGERFEVMFMNGEQDPHIQVLSQNLRDFGVETVQETFDDATFDNRRMAGEFDIMPDGSSANGIFAMWALDLVPDWIQSISHFNPTAEIPMPIGDPEGSSGTKEINVADHINNWMQNEDDDQYHQELMWWWNQHLPEFEVLWEPDAGAIDTANWQLDVREEIYNGVDDALYVAPKMEGSGIMYQP
ncbi:ABC transporter substrate-binding protein [Halomontanus rarus]|uniref:ABC transporter substrate-binding protein n=1 Tax=Halomontanus rarus TaxID=3034020 RepID=UPI001A99D5CC